VTDTSDKVIFNLKRHWNIDGKVVDLYDEIKSGRKTSEWRNTTNFWCARLIERGSISQYFGWAISHDISHGLKVHKAWFVIGYPKGNLPRLEADIIGLIYHPELKNPQLEIKFANVREILP
jgi:hypothetical protein